MPAVSVAQQHLMQAAEHGADFPMAKKVRQSMTHDQMHDFAVGSEKDKPTHVKQLKGNSSDIIHENAQSAQEHLGMSETDAVKHSIKTAHGHPGRNLGKFLHPKRGSK